MNPVTGVLVERALFPNAANPSCLVLNTPGTRLYSANETSIYEGAPSGSISAYEIERPGGRLKLINTVASEGAGPCHISLHQSGKWLFVANYHGGTSAVFPIGASGELGAASDVKRHDGVLGPDRATSAPPGSFAWSGHDRTHSHMILPDPSGRFVLAADLGLDRILVWKFDAVAGKLIPNDPPAAAVAPGDGARHFAFHPNGRLLYSLQEEGSTLVTFDYDGAIGRLTDRRSLRCRRVSPEPTIPLRSQFLRMRVSSMPRTGCTTPLPGFPSPSTALCDSLERRLQGVTIHAFSPSIHPGASSTAVTNAPMRSCHSA